MRNHRSLTHYEWVGCGHLHDTYRMHQHVEHDRDTMGIPMVSPVSYVAVYAHISRSHQCYAVCVGAAIGRENGVSNGDSGYKTV